MTRRRLFVLLAAALLVPVSALASTPAPAGSVLTGRTRTIQTIGNQLGVDRFARPALPATDALDRAGHIMDSADAAGRTPQAWIDLMRERFSTRTTPGPVRPSLDLTDQVARIYGALDLDVEPVRARIARDAAALPAPLAAEFAALVSVVADVTVEQTPLANAIAARVGDGTEAPIDVMTIAERETMMERQQRIADAIAVFDLRSRGAFPLTRPKGPPLFQDPEGLVVLGNVTNDTYTRSGMFPDPVLLVDPDGNDRYENSAGGACPYTINFAGTFMDCNGLVVSVVADLGQGPASGVNDVYTFTGAPAPIQGAGGPGGIGLLIDVGGDDRYTANLIRSNRSYFLTSYLDGGAQGFGYAGLGTQIDLLGNDRYVFTVDSTGPYSIWGLGQGFGGGGGLGVSLDASGDDEWISRARSTGGSSAFVGIYTNGTGLFGGVGIQLETGLGNDSYRSDAIAKSVDYYAFGFGAFGGVGILYEDGGNDDYYTYEEGTASQINPLLNCAFGTGSFGGLGVMIDVAGDDDYYGGTKSLSGGATVMDWGFGGPGAAYGLFVDTGGRDVYFMEAIPRTPTHYKMITGHGLFNPGFGILDGANIFGTFVDIGGNDSYVASPSGTPNGWGNNSQWVFGVDRA